MVIHPLNTLPTYLTVMRPYGFNLITLKTVANLLQCFYFIAEFTNQLQRNGNILFLAECFLYLFLLCCPLFEYFDIDDRLVLL